MPELERALAETLREHAAGTPSDAGLLAAVHRRSRRQRRRRQALTGAGGLLAAAAVGVVGLAAPWQSGGPSVPPGVGPVATTPVTSVTAPSTAAASLRFVAGSSPGPVLPLGLDPAVAGGWDPPVVEVRAGAVQATYFPHDPDGDADLVLRRTASQPPAPAGATRASVHVRGVAGTLWTVPDRQLPKRVLVWPEGGAWLSFATDDTYSATRVRQFVAGLTAQPLRPPQPVLFDTVPAGLPVTRAVQSEVDFGDRLRVLVVGAEVPVTDGVQRAGGSARVVVGFRGDDRRLQVTVTPGNLVSDEDLLGFAAGLRLTEDADPAP